MAEINKPFIEIDAENFTIAAFDTKPIDGYEIPVNETTGEKFPYCCEFHKAVFEGVKKWLEIFPNCCEPHKAMINKWWFKKSNYENLPTKIVSQISFTEYHISKQIEIPEWYKDITAYIEYNISSFGHPQIGLEHYLNNVNHYIKTVEPKGYNLPKEKRQKLIEFIDKYFAPKEAITTDLNTLYTTYQKWIEIFPFEISYFKDLKNQFANKLPFISGKLEYNKYSGLHVGNSLTKSELIEALVNTTKMLLQRIDTGEWVKQNLLADKDKHRLELLNANHRLKQSSLVSEYSNGEMQYVNVLNKWLTNEKEYFKELKEIAPTLPEPKTKTMQLSTEERRNNITTHLYNGLKKRCAAYLAELNNPLATELDFLDKEITLLNTAINELTERNNIKHHGGASDLEYKRINLLTQLKVAEQLKAELFPLSTEIKGEQAAHDIKPIFKPEAIETIFELLKDFFSKTHQTQFKQILETGNNANESLIFLDNGNRLADAFKQLIKTDIITGCQQKELESWISRNFKYRYRNTTKTFTARYLNNIVSTNKDLCQNPILNVKKDKTTGENLIVKT